MTSVASMSNESYITLSSSAQVAVGMRESFNKDISDWRQQPCLVDTGARNRFVVQDQEHLDNI